MSSAEAIRVVHQMMEAREREMAASMQPVTKKYDPANVRREFWAEVAVGPLTVVSIFAWALLMAVAQ